VKALYRSIKADIELRRVPELSGVNCIDYNIRKPTSNCNQITFHYVTFRASTAVKHTQFIGTERKGAGEITLSRFVDLSRPFNTPF